MFLLAFIYLNYDNKIRETIGGNTTEEYGLPLSFATLYLFWRLRNSNRSLIYTFLIGVIFSIALLLRPNNTGMQVAVAIFIFFAGIFNRQIYQLIKQILAFILGSLIILIPVLIYFKWNDALEDFLDLFLKFNLVYITSSLRSKIDSINYGLELLLPTGLPLLALVAWIGGMFTITGQGTLLKKNQRDLVYIGLIGMPVEFFMSAASGRHYHHYYISWLPVFTLLTCYFVFVFITQFSPTKIRVFRRELSANYLWIFAFLIIMSGITCVQIHSNIGGASGFLGQIAFSKQRPNPIIEEINHAAENEDYLLMWGAESSVNFITGIKTPTRYLYQYPLYICGYTKEEMQEEFLDDIVNNKPLIVDTSTTNKKTPPVDCANRKLWRSVPIAGRQTSDCLQSPAMDRVYGFINSAYEPVDVIEENGWTIYKYKGIQK